MRTAHPLHCLVDSSRGYLLPLPRLTQFFCKWVLVRVARRPARARAYSPSNGSRRGGDRGSLFPDHSLTHSLTPAVVPLCSLLSSGICVYEVHLETAIFAPRVLFMERLLAQNHCPSVRRSTILIVLIWIRLRARPRPSLSSPLRSVRPSVYPLSGLVVFCSLTLSKYFSPGLLRLPPPPSFLLPFRPASL